jgi:hypothetical protein
MFQGVSTNGSSLVLIRYGTSSGIESSGYTGSVWEANTINALLSSGVNISGAGNAVYVWSGCLVLNSFGSNTWVHQGNFGRSDGATATVTAGYKTTAGTLDRIRITTTNGTDAFDAGSINILYE